MFDNITVPTLIIRGGENDWDHPKRTSLEVHCLIKGSTLIDPPWPEDAWERAGEKFAASGGKKDAAVAKAADPQANQQPANAQQANPQPANPQPANAQPANPQPAKC